VAEFQELILFHPACKPKRFSPDTHPFARHDIFLTVIIAELQMLFEVLLRIAQVELGLGGQHLYFLAHTHRQSCNEIITTRRTKIGLDASMKAMLNSNFLRHALPLTKKAEPPPTRSVDRDSGTASAIGGWLQRLVEPSRCAAGLADG
jgi:hypothetical protein